MKIEKTDLGDLESQLTVVLEPADYKEEYDKKLKEYRKTAHIKGFRKGKVPMSAIRKMYGKAVLSDVVYSKLNKSLEDYIVNEELDILGNPLPSAEQEIIDFDQTNLRNFEFKFDLGLAPKFEVKGAGDSDEYENFKIELSDTDLDEEIESLQKRMGKQEEVDLPIEEKDIVTLKIDEVSNDSEELYSGEITIMPERMTEEYKSSFLGQKVGYRHQVNIFNIEADASDDYIKKYFLKDAPDSVTDAFDTEVLNVKRLIPAELNDEFFQTAFGNEEVSDIDTAKKRIKEDLDKFYESQALSITKRKILLNMIDLNEVDMPDDFLKRWLLASNDQLTPQQVEDDYEGFVKNLRWTLIKNKLGKKYEIQVSPDDIKQAMIEKTKAQFAQYGYGIIQDFDYDGMADKMMQNQEQVQKEYEEILAERVLDSILNDVTLKDLVINTEEYKAIVEDLRQNNQ